MRVLPAAVWAVAVLVMMPSASSAFLLPKSWVLLAGALVSLPFALRSWRAWCWPALAMLLVVVVSATVNDAWNAPATLALCAGLLAMTVWPALAPQSQSTARVVAVPAVLVSGLAVLQAFGVDVFGANAPGRLAVSSTLGNPDFVASVLGAAVWLVLPMKRGAWVAAACVAGLVATRSFASVFAFSAAAMFVMARRGARWWLAGVLVLISLGVVGRDVTRAIRGRQYLHTVAASGLSETRWLGGGSGVVELRWPSWEADWWLARCDDAACVEAHPLGAFNGAQTHVHDDWLEFALEFGVPGVVSLFVLVIALGRAAWRADQPFAGAVLVSLAARALVDFPLHRAADLASLALAAALVWATRREHLSVQRRDTERDAL